MGATTRAAAQRKAKAEATNLLDLPDSVLERILVAASYGGDWESLRKARGACSRLRAAADLAARRITLRIASSSERGLAPLALLPRLGALSQVHVMVVFDADDDFYKCAEDGADCFVESAEEIAQATCWHCPSLTELWIDGARVLPVVNLARSFRLLAGTEAPPLPLLTTLSLDWAGTLTEPLAPLARLTRLTALELYGFAKGVKATDWLPPNLEELHLSGRTVPKRFCPHGIGGAGWLAALHAGACPRLRALRLSKLAVRDVRPHGRWDGLTLENTLPRLTALEELVVTAYRSASEEDYDHHHFCDSDDDNSANFGSAGSVFSDDGDDDDDDGGVNGGGAWAYALPIPAAPLLAALPNLRRCRVQFLRLPHDRDLQGDMWTYMVCRTTPMLYATPAELSALHAPKLESLVLGLKDPKSGNELSCYCGDEDDLGVGGAAAAGIGAGSGLPALRSLGLHVGCPRMGGWDASVWDLSGLTPGSLPALRRLLMMPRCFDCRAARLPLDAMARAAPGLERLVIDPRCAGPLDALFCDGVDGCAHTLRWLAVLPPLAEDTVTPARIDAELRAGLRARAAAGAAAPIKVTLFASIEAPKLGADAQRSAARAYARGATVVRRLYDGKDGDYVANFLLTGLRRGTLPAAAQEFSVQVDAYERMHA